MATRAQKPVCKFSERELLDALLEHSPDRIYFKDCESRFVRLSRPQAEKLGLSDPVETLNKTDFDFFTEEHASQAFSDEQQIIDNPSEFEVQLCGTVSAAIEVLGHSTPDVIVADLLLPDCTGTESIDRIRRCAPDVPLLALTSLNDEDVALECLKRGAQDYLVKANINAQALRRCLRYSLERQRVQLQEFSKALTDDLTGFQNRRGFLRFAEHHVKVAYRTHKPFLLSFIDLDGLKRINDSFGHQEGNRALVEAANVIRDSFRACDILSRIGGDELLS